MINKNQAVMDWLEQCPYVGPDNYFNFIDATQQGNTSLLTSPYGYVERKYVDGGALKKYQYEIRQNKTLSKISNTSENIDNMQAVQLLLNWVNKQGKIRNFPAWDDCTIVDIRTPDGVDYPSMAGQSDDGALYAFPFEILYTERI